MEVVIKLVKMYIGCSIVISFFGGYYGMMYGVFVMIGNLFVKNVVNGLMLGV